MNSAKTDRRDLPTTARLLLAGRPRPQLTDAVRVAERVRLALLGRARSLLGEHNIPAVLSGHALPRDAVAHGHAFFLPEDADGDGRIDHVVVHAALGLDEDCRRVLDQIRVVLSGDGGQWDVLLENIADPESMARSSALLGLSRRWISVTPYLHPWHRKKRFSIEDQITRELQHRGVPAPTRIEPVETVSVHGRPLRPVRFHRFRSRRGLHQPDTRGSFWRLTFDEPLRGPLALGFACHFGLGLFRPDNGGKDDDHRP